MDMTIVITTYNRAYVLDKLLTALESQSDRNFQVVVAIDGATDNTEQMLETRQTPFAMKWVNTRCKGYGLAVARNMGILAADGEIVAIIDDDCFPVTDYVAACKQSVKRHTITGGLRTPESPTDMRQVWKMQELSKLPACSPLSFPELHHRWPTAVATECNIWLYKSDFIDMGLFSERLKIYGFIGQEFFARAAHLQYKYQFDPRAEIVHKRQKDGDNELSQKKKVRETIVAKALRPSFMDPDQYAIQRSWANLRAAKYPEPCALPPFPKSAFLAFPYRFLRSRAGALKRRLFPPARHK